jgi:hypothetical protein
LMRSGAFCLSVVGPVVNRMGRPLLQRESERRGRTRAAMPTWAA